MGIFIMLLSYYHKNQQRLYGDQVYEGLRALPKPGDGVQDDLDPGVDAAPRTSEMDFKPLKTINSDVVGWIVSGDSIIDYPVAQTVDNSFYLEHLFTKEANTRGSIFMDYRNAQDLSNRNTVLYGHNMRDGSMFAALTRYKTQEYYDEFPTMRFYTCTAGDFYVELFAGKIVDGGTETIPVDFASEADFESYVARLKQDSTFKSDINPEQDDRIITLCTCTYEFDNARYLLFGKLSRANPEMSVGP